MSDGKTKITFRVPKDYSNLPGTLKSYKVSSVVHSGWKIINVKSGEFGDVVKVEKLD